MSTRSPNVDWEEVGEWYKTVIEVGRSWPSIYDELVDADPSLATTFTALEEIEVQILAGQEHAQKLGLCRGTFHHSALAGEHLDARNHPRSPYTMHGAEDWQR